MSIADGGQRTAHVTIVIGTTRITVEGDRQVNRAGVVAARYDRGEFLLAVTVAAQTAGILREHHPTLFAAIDATRQQIAEDK